MLNREDLEEVRGHIETVKLSLQEVASWGQSADVFTKLRRLRNTLEHDAGRLGEALSILEDV